MRIKAQKLKNCNSKNHSSTHAYRTFRPLKTPHSLMCAPHPVSHATPYLTAPPTHTHTTLVSCPHPQTMFHLPPLQHHTSHVPSNMLQLAIGPEHLTLGNECCHTHWDIQNYKGDNQQNGDNQHYHGDNHRLPLGQPILQFPANMSIIQIKPRAVVVRCNYETITAAP